jgi:hypothetical protein
VKRLRKSCRGRNRAAFPFALPVGMSGAWYWVLRDTPRSDASARTMRWEAADIFGSLAPSVCLRKSGSFDVGRDVCAEDKGVPNVIVLKCKGETFRVDEFSIPEDWGGTRIKLGGEMKPCGRKCDSPIEDLPWFTCMLLTISDDLEGEVNLGFCRKNLTEPLAHPLFAHLLS